MTTGRSSWGAVRIAWDDAATSDLRFGGAVQRFGAFQQRRLAALQGGAADRFVVGRELIAIVIDEMAADAGASGGPPPHETVELTASCDRCGGEHGALRVHGLPLVVSVSYAGSVVAVAVAWLDDAAAIGVDIEPEQSGGSLTPLPSLSGLFAPAPAPSVQGWTMLEAALKADGRGIVVDVAQCRIQENRRGTEVSIPGRIEPVPVATLAGPAGFVLSAAAIAPSSSNR